MSGAEGILVLGVIANIVQLVDASQRWSSQLIDAYRGKQTLTTALQDIVKTLPILTEILRQTQTLITEQELDDDTCKALRPVITSYKENLEKLNNFLERITLGTKSSTTRRIRNAISIFRTESEIEKTATNLRGYLPLLTIQHITAIRTKKDAEMAAGEAKKLEKGKVILI